MPEISLHIKNRASFRQPVCERNCIVVMSTKRVSEQITPLDKVRIVNLPSHPGLEGLVGTVVSVDADDLSAGVELDSTGVIKKVRHYCVCL